MCFKMVLSRFLLTTFVVCHFKISCHASEKPHPVPVSITPLPPHPVSSSMVASSSSFLTTMLSCLSLCHPVHLFLHPNHPSLHYCPPLSATESSLPSTSESPCSTMDNPTDRQIDRQTTQPGSGFGLVFNSYKLSLLLHVLVCLHPPAENQQCMRLVEAVLFICRGHLLFPF